MERTRVGILDLEKKKKEKVKITMLTAYDYPMARLIDQAGVDIILVGDSLGMVVLGYDSTVPVTMDDMLHHCKAVRRGTERAFVVGDMPFMSYHVSDEEAVRNAGRLVKEAGCDAVKMEGGQDMIERVRAVIKAGIPVFGHIGLTPQTAGKLGGYRVQGRTQTAARKLLEDAVELDKAGCSALVIECVPSELARKITSASKIPVIGIGAGKHCDGQVLVTHDVVGYFDRFVPKFVKRYANINDIMFKAVGSFKDETERGDFPGEDQSFS